MSISIPGFWECSCGAGNSPNRTTCGRCHAEKPVYGIKPKEVKTTKESKPKGMNQAERDVYNQLRAEYPQALIISQCPKLTFSDGTSYTPDLFLLWPGEWLQKPMIAEVKGGYRGPGWEQGYERFRRARDVFSKYFSIRMYEKKDGEWRVL